MGSNDEWLMYLKGKLEQHKKERQRVAPADADVRGCAEVVRSSSSDSTEQGDVESESAQTVSTMALDPCTEGQNMGLDAAEKSEEEDECEKEEELPIANVLHAAEVSEVDEPPSSH